MIFYLNVDDQDMDKEIPDLDEALEAMRLAVESGAGFISLEYYKDDE